MIRVLEWCDARTYRGRPLRRRIERDGRRRAAPGGDYRGSVSIDLTRLDKVLEIDRVSRAARIQGGVLGPALEDQLRPHGYTLRHFPQSFEFSTLGGWIATRSGGHFATLYTHIDDFVESVRVVTPTGIIESLRLPARAPGRVPIGCLSARKAPSASSPRPGCACRTARIPRRRVDQLSRFRRPGPKPCARSRRPACIRLIAACSIRARPPTPAPTRATRPSWCSPSSPPIIRWSPG